ncbi:MAG: hypothetical protein HYS25_10050 [Ignavibacteriales bacterium]|nr:hypothetical protein [Ignavibacteriales bacterium]
MKNNNFNDWTIEKGDYKRDDTSTWRYVRKQILRKRIKYTLITVFYLTTVSIIAYLLFS